MTIIMKLFAIYVLIVTRRNQFKTIFFYVTVATQLHIKDAMVLTNSKPMLTIMKNRGYAKGATHYMKTILVLIKKMTATVKKKL